MNFQLAVATSNKSKHILNLASEIIKTLHIYSYHFKKDISNLVSP